MNEPELVGRFDPGLVALSVTLAIMASGAALDLAGRTGVRRGRAQAPWLLGGAVALGVGIWSMHYTGMLAFELAVPIRYDLWTVILSLVAAVGASLVVLRVTSHPKLTSVGIIGGSLVMGGGIAAMHYVGMAAMRVPAMMTYRIPIVVASVVIAIAVSAVALFLAFRFGHSGSDAWTWPKMGAALLMGAAISSMHYTGMAATRFTADSAVLVSTADTISLTVIGKAAVVSGTLLLLGIAIASSIVDRRFSIRTQLLNQALAEVKTLRGLFSICATCKKLRNDQGAWEQIESYVRRNTEAEFSHGICPDCLRRFEEENGLAPEG